MLIIWVQPPGAAAPSNHEVVSGPFDIGRFEAADDVPRCVVSGDPSVSRNHARLLEHSPGNVSLTNTSQRVPIGIEGGIIGPGETRVLLIPATFTIGNTTVTVDQSEDESDVVKAMVSLGTSPILQPRMGRFATAGTEQDASVVAAWFETLLTVQRASAGSKEFYAQTARALVQQIGMDIGLVLIKQQSNWKVTARFADEKRVGVGMSGREFSMTVLDHLTREKRTIYQTDDIPTTESLVQVKALVASPVLLPNGEVAGALYGLRSTPHAGKIAISPLEAQMVQVLATAIGIGLARVAQEEETAKLRVQLHEQFSNKLASELESDLRRLDPQDREVTIMFADIRGFSRISERLGATETFRLVSEVMEVMSETVKRNDGAVLDYIGDELLAIWNAPADQADHAALSVRCAASIMPDLAALSKSWEGKLGEPLRVGVGLNTGPARVGNTGTKSKPKYGALGHTVNLASRVQGASKAFVSQILLTGSTRERLPASVTVRRLGKVKVVGINDSVELFQYMNDPAMIPAEVLNGYAAALTRFEASDLPGTIESLKTLQALPAGRMDGATRQLAARVEALMAEGATEFAPVFELTSK